LLQDKVIDSLKILAAYQIPYDVVGVLTDHIETVLKVVKKVPDLEMVFDHLNQPPIGTRDHNTRWHWLMSEAAEHQNLYVKISGLGTASKKPGTWTADDIEPAVEFVLKQFGTDRCFCGGDWPVSLLAGSYSQTWTAYKELLAKLLSKEQQEKVFCKNAEAFYRL
jgi:L-fuconolactonase